jgi:N-dimethylarginine dimethylaminohydrolase
MCPPDHFEIAYVINPWMEGQFASTSAGLARQQWDDLRAIVEKHANVVLQPPQRDLPDIVFTANAGLVFRKKAIVSRFRSPERQGEEKHNRAWFTDSGFDILDWPQEIFFEGAGDALFDRGQDLLWVGHGFRSDATVAALLQKMLDIKTVALNLVDPRFYHLDTCLCPLSGGTLLYFPAAFDAQSQAAIEARVPADKRIAVEEADALKFCCNAVDLGSHIVMNAASDALQKRLNEAGFTPVLAPLSEFMKAGGAAKCLTLKLVEV